MIPPQDNLTDYVTEKVFNVWRSGSVPVCIYNCPHLIIPPPHTHTRIILPSSFTDMGAPNIEDWTPGPNSLIRTDQFTSPNHLAEHLIRLSKDQRAYEAHLAWKRGELSARFRQKVQRCVVYGAECRLCLKYEPRAQKQQLIGSDLHIDWLSGD